MAQDHTRPDAKTREAEAHAERTAHDADRGPTAEEERSAEKTSVDPDVERSYEEAMERGAAQKGEGRI